MGPGLPTDLQALRQGMLSHGVVIEPSAIDHIEKHAGEEYVNHDGTLRTIEDYATTEGYMIVAGGLGTAALESSIVNTSTFRAEHGAETEHKIAWVNARGVRDDGDVEPGARLYFDRLLGSLAISDNVGNTYPAGFVLPHRFRDHRLSNGRPLTDYLHLHANRFRGSPAQGCSVVCQHGCNIPYERIGEKLPSGQEVRITPRGTVAPLNYGGVKDPREMEEAYALAIHLIAERDGISPEEVSNRYWGIMSGGIPSPPDYEAMLAHWKIQAKFLHEPEIMMVPVEGMGGKRLIDPKVLREIGIGGLYFNPDIVGPDQEELNGQKHRQLGSEGDDGSLGHIVRYLKEAKKYFVDGDGRVNGRLKVMFMIGPFVNEKEVVPAEYFEDLFRWMDAVMAEGADVILSPFRQPDVGPSKDRREPTPEEIAYVMRYGQLLQRHHRNLGVIVGARNGPSSNNITAYSTYKIPE